MERRDKTKNVCEGIYFHYLFPLISTISILPHKVNHNCCQSIEKNSFRFNDIKKLLDMKKKKVSDKKSRLDMIE